MKLVFLRFQERGVFVSACILVVGGGLVLGGSGSGWAQATSPAADISGKWVGTVQAPYGELEYYFEFQMSKDGTLQGVHYSNSGDIPLVEGRVHGRSARWVEETEQYGTIRKSTMIATIIGDQIQVAEEPRSDRGTGAAGASKSGGSFSQPTGSEASAKPAVDAVVGGSFALPPALLHRGEPAPSYRAGPLSYQNLPKNQLPELATLPYNGLAATPPMGWNSWNKFATKIDDRTVRGVADSIASNGMKDAGYRYIVIDDGWEGKRDSQGKILPNQNFPDMKALADYVHSKGLKIGIYSSPGPRTCGGYEGSYGHEEQDARSYADWGFDYLKYDWCSGSRAYPESFMRAAYQKMGAALENSGRSIVYALCQYGRDEVEKWAPSVGANLWRTTADISDRYQSMTRNGFSESNLAAYAAPGHWNDPDMLEVGNGGMTVTEYRAHFSLWALLAAPLLAGNDVRALDAQTREILLNAEVIAVDQDALGKQATRVSQTDVGEVWARSIQGNAFAVGLFNRSDREQTMSISWSALNLADAHSVRDLWGHKNLSVTGTDFSAQVPAHGVVMIKVKP